MARPTILVAEDFEGFREFVCNELRQHEFDVTAVADGAAAVNAARDLRPDLVLLDIGLPTLNGLDAAAQIRAESPDATIVFLTQESSPDIVDAARRLGAHGYVLKTRAQRWMMPAIEAILARAAADGHAGRRRGARAPLAHHVQFFADATGVVTSAERCVHATLEAGDAALVVLVPPHLEAFEALVTRHPSVPRAIERGIFRALDATGVLASLGPGRDADWTRFHTSFREMIVTLGTATGRPEPRVVVFGEIASAPFAAGQFGTVLRLEQIGHQLVADPALPAVELTCAYPLSHATAAASFTQICAAHSALACT